MKPIVKRFTETPEFRETLSKKLAAYNDENSPYHKALRPIGGECFELEIHTDAGELAAGLYGEVYWNALEVDKLFVEPNFRHDGLGKQLMAEAENIAREKNCVYMHLNTFSFQAPDFYQKLGFKIVGELEDFPPGHSKIWLRKTL